MNLFTDKTIHKRVMDVVRTRIASGQQKYEEGVAGLVEEFNKGYEELEKKHIADREMLVNNIVAGIFKS